MDKKDVKKFFIIQYVIIGLLVILCLFLVFDRRPGDPSNNKHTENNSNGYDVSMMNEVNVSDILKMFEDGKSHVLYIGRETCGVCKSILPNLQSAQKNLNYVTQYLDITKANRNSDEWEEVEKLLDKETSINVTNNNGEKEIKTESYGYFVGTYGYTPTLIIINNNKMVAGHIGNFSLDDLEAWLQSNGIG